MKQEKLKGEFGGSLLSHWFYDHFWGNTKMWTFFLGGGGFVRFGTVLCSMYEE